MNSVIVQSIRFDVTFSFKNKKHFKRFFVALHFANMLDWKIAGKKSAAGGSPEIEEAK